MIASFLYYKNMYKIFLIIMIPILILLNGCGSKVNIIEKGTITETKDVIKEGLKGLKEGAESLTYTTWKEEKIAIPVNNFQIVYSDWTTSVQSYNKKILCEFSSDKPVNIYAIPYDNLDKAKDGQSVSMFPACSSENSLNFKCSESCIVPLDTIYFIKNNNQDSIANIEIKLKYRIVNVTSS